ncbi:flagellar biosynthetic protein FliR [Pelagibaculum spongiae]|uniref:Flagellar biosynthetic protein FliR n=1 Tax=Pelagibaculum spongiae TaxID=2080658 RepID=A0A2V1GR57_9GAMM|nr:flagellar biosynthetic protein FliR [Pelagibaculum spongiae]PVZ66712.1 flagellar biosynthetic protein FliR [Pelagibaculum spongiae]
MQPEALFFSSSLDQLISWVESWLLPLFRISSMWMAMPLFGSVLMTAKIRLAASLALGMVMIPSLPVIAAIDPLSPQMILLVAREIGIGAVIGFMLQLVFQAAVFGGQLISNQTGLGFAAMVAPQNGVTVPMVAQLYQLLCGLMFLTMNGHLVLIRALQRSFEVMPVAAGNFDPNILFKLVSFVSWVFAGGVMVALPAVAALLFINFSFGVMSRAAPQFNIISIGFPITMLCGYVIVWYTLSSFLGQLGILLERTFIALEGLIV